MENPEHEIRPIIRSLCQGTPTEQKRALERFFTKDASFVHPFCIAPSFGEGNIPVLSKLSSRDVIQSIFQWYRMLSPKIDIEVDAALHDKIRDKMYLDIRQTFSVWFLPMYHAHVRLVTVLDLVASDDADFHDPLDRIIKQDEDSEKSTAQILFDSMSEQGHHRRHSRAGNNGPRRYKIQRQEDLYQVNDFLKFVGGPGPLPFLWFLFQLQATVICVLMSLFVRISPWAFQPDPAKGGVEAIIERVESYHTITSSERGGTKEESPRHVDDLDKKPSHQHIEDKKPPVTLVIKNTHGENKNGGEKAAEGSGATNAHNGNHHTQENEQQHQQKPKHNEQQDNASNSGRESANSKVSPTQPRKKSGKKGGR